MTHSLSSFLRVFFMRKPLRDWAGLALLGAGYWLTVWAGMRLAAEARGALTVWPASGVALGTLLIVERRLWRRVLAAMFAAQTGGYWLLGLPLWESAGFSFFNALEALLCAWMLTRFFRPSFVFQRAAEVIGLFAAVALSAASVSALQAAFALASPQLFVAAWIVRWMANGLGMLIMAPLVALWDSASLKEYVLTDKKRLWELALFFLILISFALPLFGVFTQAEKPLLRNYMLFPLLIWAAFRFNTRDLLDSLFAYSAVAVWNTQRGFGVFSFPLEAQMENFPSLQIYLSVVLFSGLLISAMVNERKNVERALRESRNLLSAFIARSPIYAFIKSATPSESRVLFASDNYIDMIGVPSAQMIDKTMRELFPAEFADKITAEDWQVASKGEVLQLEETLNGRVYTTIKFPIRLEDRAVLAGYTIDITERKQMEETLRKSEEKYRLVANFTYDWECWHGPDGSYLYVSPSCERITGYTAEEFIADPQLLIKITHPEDRVGVMEHFEATSGRFKQRDVAFDFRIIAKDGRTRWIYHTCTAVYGSNGEWMGRRESNRDVTSRKQAESVLRSRLRLSRFAETHSADEVLQYTLNEAEALTDSQIGFFHSFDSQKNAVALQMWSSNTLQNFCSAGAEKRHYSLEEAGVWADCIRRREPLIYNDYSSLPHRKGVPQGHAPLQRVALVPVFQGDHVVAVVGVGNKPAEYDYQDVKIIQQITELAWDVIQRKRSEEEVRLTQNALQAANRELQVALEREKILAHTDSLTGVPNRRYLFDLAEREFSLACRHHLPLAAMMLDLDFFKKVNDTFGHEAGDRALQSVVEAARSELRASDFMGRYGGEEFVVFLPMTTGRQALPLAERIRAKTESLRIQTQRGEISVTVSIGVADLAENRELIQTVDDLIRLADEAMYAAKQAGRNRVVLYGR